MPSDKDLELLSALADGELGGCDEIRLKERVKSDESFRKSHEEILDLKKKVSELHQDHNIEYSPHDTGKDKKSIKVQICGLVAACLAGAFVVVSLFYINTNFLNGQNLKTAYAWHQKFSAEQYVVKEEQSPLFISVQADEDVKLPDLSASRLFLVDYRSFDASSPEIAVMHYRGFRGCRLTIWMGSERPVSVENDKTSSAKQVYGWNVHKRYFQVVASGMDRARFEAIAFYVEKMTRIGTDSITQQHMAMVDTYENSKPCA